MGVWSISVDSSNLFLATVEKVQLDIGGTAVFVAGTADEPAAFAFSFAGNGYVVARFSFEHAGIVPVHGHVLDELEGVEVQSDESALG